MNKLNIKTKELFSTDCPFLKDVFENAEYPWEILPQIKEIVKKVVETGLDGYTEIEPGVLVGENVKIAKGLINEKKNYEYVDWFKKYLVVINNKKEFYLANEYEFEKEKNIKNKITKQEMDDKDIEL